MAKLRTFNRYSCLASSNEHSEEGVITVGDSTETEEAESTEKPLEVGDVVVGLFVVYRMALFEHRVLFDIGYADEDSASSDYDEIQAAEEGSATSTGDDHVLVSITGGGDQETNDVSPPSKRRKKGKGRAKQLDRRRKYSKSNVNKDVNITPEESGETEIENVTPTTSPRLDRKAAWRQSPQGRASSAASRRKYEMSPLAKSTRRRYKTSEEGIEKMSRYESSEERTELKRRNESTTKSKETRRRYWSTEGRFIRAEAAKKYEKTKHGRESRKRATHKYGNSEGGRQSIKRSNKKYGNTEDGRESIKRATQKYGNTEDGRKSRARARKKYELKEAAQKRKLCYKQRKAYYNRRVKKAIKHLSTQAAKITESQRPNDDDQTDEKLIHPGDGAENSCSNKEAMATIRSHKVCHF